MVHKGTVCIAVRTNPSWKCPRANGRSRVQQFASVIQSQASSGLSNLTSVAVYQDGSWKVGVASFCGLLALENGGKTSSLSAACKAAGQPTPSSATTSR